MARGKLITIEGLDGAGKTTLASALLIALRDWGVEAQLLREPGGVRAAELIRDLVKDPVCRSRPGLRRCSMRRLARSWSRKPLSPCWTAA